MSWEKEIKELKNREKIAEQMGGSEKLKRQKDNKRLNVRERIDLLLDKNSFHEIGKIAGQTVYHPAYPYGKPLCLELLYQQMDFCGIPL